MKVVLDANVLISAFTSRGLCVEIYRTCLAKHEVFLSDRLLEETRRGFTRKFGMPAALAEEFIDSIKTDVRMEEPMDVPSHSCGDPKDLHVLGLALAAQADYLVSGDKDLWSLKKFEKTIILPPRGFWEELRIKEGPQKQRGSRG